MESFKEAARRLVMALARPWAIEPQSMQRTDRSLLRCEICGCTGAAPCFIHGVPCCWIHDYEYPICSACAPLEATASDPTGRAWLSLVMRVAQASREGRTFEMCVEPFEASDFEEADRATA